MSVDPWTSILILSVETVLVFLFLCTPKSLCEMLLIDLQQLEWIPTASLPIDPMLIIPVFSNVALVEVTWIQYWQML